MKLGPLVPGHLLLDAFELARDIRLLDMQAAPYDDVACTTERGRAPQPEPPTFHALVGARTLAP